jgi:hypothetical protein
MIPGKPVVSISSFITEEERGDGYFSGRCTVMSHWCPGFLAEELTFWYLQETSGHFSRDSLPIAFVTDSPHGPLKHLRLLSYICLHYHHPEDAVCSTRTFKASDVACQVTNTILKGWWALSSCPLGDMCMILMMQLTPGGLVEVTEFDTRDGIYDCAWSEVRTVMSDMKRLRLWCGDKGAHPFLLVPPFHTG